MMSAPENREEHEVLDEREALKAQAERTRTRLFQTLDALDQRRQAVVAVGQQAKGALVPVGVGVAGMLMMLLTATVVSQRRALRRARSDWRRVLIQRLVPEPPPRGFLTEATHRAGVALVLLAATELGKRVIRAL